MITTKVMVGVEWRFFWDWFAWFFITVDMELQRALASCTATTNA
jgi:hypothetical protein